MALPDTGGDLYLQHQRVWEAMHGKVRGGGPNSFLYAMLSPRLAIVRSTHLDRGHVSAFAARPLKMTLVTAKQRDGRLWRLDGDEAAEKIRALLFEHGLQPDGLTVEHQRDLVGNKTRESQRIVLPVSDVRFVPVVLDAGRAQLAWRDGVGRGKRFGCGMLRNA